MYSLLPFTTTRLLFSAIELQYLRYCYCCQQVVMDVCSLRNATARSSLPAMQWRSLPPPAARSAISFKGRCSQSPLQKLRIHTQGAPTRSTYGSNSSSAEGWKRRGECLRANSPSFAAGFNARHQRRQSVQVLATVGQIGQLLQPETVFSSATYLMVPIYALMVLIPRSKLVRRDSSEP